MPSKSPHSLKPLFFVWLYTFVLLFIHVIYRLYEEKGVILPLETEEGAFLVLCRDLLLQYRWILFGIALFITLFSFFRAPQKRALFFVFFTLIGLVSTFIHPYWGILSIYSLYFYFLWNQKQHPSPLSANLYSNCLHLQGMDLLRFIPPLVFAGIFAGSLVCLLEGYFFVADDIGRGFTQADYWGTLCFALSASTLHGTFMGLQMFGVMVIVILVEQTLAGVPHRWNFWTIYLLLTGGVLYSLQNYYFRYIWQWYLKFFLIVLVLLSVGVLLKFLIRFKKNKALGPELFFSLLASWLALIVCLWLRVLVLDTLYDEISALDLYIELQALTFSTFPILAVLIHKNFFLFLEKEPFQTGDSFSLLSCFLLLNSALLLSPIYFFLRLLSSLSASFFSHLRLCFSLLSLTFILFCLYQLNYTDVVDYSDITQFIYSQIIIGLVLLALLFLGEKLFSLTTHPVRSLSLQFLCIILILGLSAFWIFLNYQEDIYAMVIAEYATIWRIQSESYRLDYFPDRMYDLKKLEPGTFSFHQMPQLPEHTIPFDFLSEKPPIIMVLWDAGRPDHFSCYGYAQKTHPPRVTTPHIDRFCEEAVLFENAYSQATATNSGMRQLLNGHYTTRYMLDQENVDPFWIHKLIPFGYDHLLVNALGSLYNGVPREAYYLKMPEDIQKKVHYFAIDGDEEERITNLFQEIDQKQLRNGFFSLLHYINTHIPWENHPKGTYYGEGYMDKYDNCINYQDRLFGKLVEELKKRDLYEKSIIIILADHGTGLNDHGRWGSFLPYQEQIRVPLIMKIPGIPPQRIQENVGLIDVGPTLLNLFYQNIPNKYHGVSLIPLLQGKMKTIPRDYLFALCAFEDAYTVIEAQRWKCVLHRRRQYWKLYDLEKDPKETRNLAKEYPEHIEHFRNIFKQYLSAGLFSYANPYHYRSWSYLENH